MYLFILGWIIKTYVNNTFKCSKHDLNENNGNYKNKWHIIENMWENYNKKCHYILHLKSYNKVKYYLAFLWDSLIYNNISIIFPNE